LYELRIKKRVEKTLTNPKALSAKNAVALSRRIEELRNNPRPHDSEQLQGSQQRFRLTQGEYRILYEIDHKAKVVTVVDVRHRREAYR
jgi:mRNA interferase RelE/StbE